MRSTDLATGSPGPQLQAEFAVQPMDPFCDGSASLTAQQEVDKLVALGHTDFRQFLDATFQGVLGDRRDLYHWTELG